MGIDINGLNFLRYAKKNKTFGKTISIGRQDLAVSQSAIKSFFGSGLSYKQDKYIDNLLLDFFGASSIDSVDNSDYEQASIIHDMNLPLSDAMHCCYDTVIDGGSLEHIYNLPQALKNCSLLCRPGGQIIHILPAINHCGHGFWQFSPELFFSLYSIENGYIDTEIFLCDIFDRKKWFKVIPPKNGQRVEVYSCSPVYVLVRTVLSGAEFLHENIQQSDYRSLWSKGDKKGSIDFEDPVPKTIKSKIKNSPLVYKLLLPIYVFYMQNFKLRLSGQNPGLIPIKVGSLLTER